MAPKDKTNAGVKKPKATTRSRATTASKQPKKQPAKPRSKPAKPKPAKPVISTVDDDDDDNDDHKADQKDDDDDAIWNPYDDPTTITDDVKDAVQQDAVNKFRALRTEILTSLYKAKGTRDFIGSQMLAPYPLPDTSFDSYRAKHEDGTPLFPTYSDVDVSRMVLPPSVAHPVGDPGFGPSSTEGGNMCAVNSLLAVMRYLGVGTLGCDTITTQADLQKLSRVMTCWLAFMRLPHDASADHINRARDLVAHATYSSAGWAFGTNLDMADLIDKCLFDTLSPFGTSYHHFHQFTHTVGYIKWCTVCHDPSIEHAADHFTVLNSTDPMTATVESQVNRFYTHRNPRYPPTACTKGTGCNGRTTGQNLVLDRMPFRLILGSGFESGTGPNNIVRRAEDYLDVHSSILITPTISGGILTREHRVRYGLRAIFAHVLHHGGAPHWIAIVRSFSASPGWFVFDDTVKHSDDSSPFVSTTANDVKRILRRPGAVVYVTIYEQEALRPGDAANAATTATGNRQRAH